MEFKQTIKYDAISALTVALVALPLGLGISLASGVNPLAGVWSAIIGGLICTFIRGSHVSINGPGNGLIVVVVTGLTVLNLDIGSMLAVFFVSGVLVALFGVLKMGNYADIIPSSVVYGLMAGIGLIIVTNQIYPALDTQPLEKSRIGYLTGLPHAFSKANVLIGVITIISLTVLFLHPRIKNRFIHFIPSPVWVLLFIIPVTYWMGFAEGREFQLGDKVFLIGTDQLISIPKKFDLILGTPQFSRIGDSAFWIMVGSVTFLVTLESLVSSKAVEKLDPDQRTVNHNKDLVANGLATMASAFLGGLPVVTVVARSSINVNHGAKTRWSNLLHALFLVLFLFFLIPVLNKVPQAALAAVLIYTGYRLVAPPVWIDMMHKGKEQLLIFCVSMLATIFTGLIMGVAIGIVVNFMVHLFKVKMPLNMFVQRLFKPNFQIIKEEENRSFLRVRGVLSFVNLLAFRKKLAILPKEEILVIGFSGAALVDHTALEFVLRYTRQYRSQGGKIDLVGLEVHRVSSEHPTALHILDKNKRHLPQSRKLTERQKDLLMFASKNGWRFDPEICYKIVQLNTFDFFQTRPIPFSRNIIYGSFPHMGVTWEVSDVTFDEGALIASEEYHSTVLLINLPSYVTPFVLEKEDFFEKLVQFFGAEDIDFAGREKFSNEFVLRGPNENEIRELFTDELIDFFENSEFFHIECNGNEMIIFKNLRFVGPWGIEKLISFSETLLLKLPINTDQNDSSRARPQKGRETKSL